MPCLDLFDQQSIAYKKKILGESKNIKQYLISLGINEDRVSTFYEGESSPLAPNNSDLNKQLNRRVDLEVVK